MSFFHPHYIADIELSVQHSLFYTLHRTDIRYIVTGFTDLLNNIHTMLRKVSANSQLRSICIITLGYNRNDINALIAEHTADISNNADLISNIYRDTSAAFSNAHDGNESTENIAVRNNAAQRYLHSQQAER